MGLNGSAVVFPFGDDGSGTAIDDRGGLSMSLSRDSDDTGDREEDPVISLDGLTDGLGGVRGTATGGSLSRTLGLP